MTPAARILALVREVLLEHTFDHPDDVVDAVCPLYMEARMTALLAEIERERAEAEPVWSPG